MRHSLFASLSLTLAALSASAWATSAPPGSTVPPSSPIAFERNQGQASPEVDYLVRGAGYNIYLEPHQTQLSMVAVGPSATSGRHGTVQAAHLTTRLIDANDKATAIAQGSLPSYSNYFVGPDPSKWLRKVPHFERVAFDEVYRGIDLVYYGNQTRLEYDFVVEPGADPAKIRMAIDGARALSLDADGNLLIAVDGGQLVQHAPIAYQTIGNERTEVAARFVLDSGQVTFELGRYDATSTLYIDPVLTYSSYLGGEGTEFSQDLALDAEGNVYITGYTTGGYPTVTPLQPDDADPELLDAFVTKIDPAGNAILWSTFFGGADNDQATGIAIDDDGNPAIVGSTTGTIATVDPFQSNPGGLTDAFVARISSDGTTLLMASYLGGPRYDAAEAVAVTGGSLVVAGNTEGQFPRVAGFQANFGGEGDGFVAKITGSTVNFASYLGGATYDLLDGLAIGPNGDIYVSGATDGGFPVKLAYQSTHGGGGLDDAFVTRIRANGTATVFSTYLGGNRSDGATDIAVDSSGNAVIVGYTSGNFRIANAVQGTYGGATDAFAAKLAAAGSSLLWSTYIGGSGVDVATALAHDAAGNLLIGGYTSGSFPVINPVQPAFGGGGRDALVLKLKPDGSQVLWSTFLGGTGGESVYAIAADPAGYAIVTGDTTGGFPTTAALQDAFGGATDVFFARLGDEAIPPTLTLSIDPASIELGESAALEWQAQNAPTCVASGDWAGTFLATGTQTVTPTTGGAKTYSMNCTGSGGSVSKTVSLAVTVPPPEPTLEFIADPTSIHVGESATLSWTATNATSCSASGAWSGIKPTTGAQNVTPAAVGTTQYTLLCTGDGGTVSKVATIAVTDPPPPPTLNLSVAPSSITQGQSATITWSTSGADSCTASGAWSGSRNVSGSQSVTPETTGNFSYTLTCLGEGGSTTRTGNLIVSAPTPPPSLNFSISPATIFRGESATLTWSSTAANSCTASGAWSGGRALTGSQAVSPTTTGNFSYHLSCTGDGGTTSKSVTLTVNAPPPTLTLSIAPSSIEQGKSATITWAPAHSDSCTASGAWSGVKSATGGSQSIAPATVGSHVFSMQCTGAGGNVTQTATLVVTEVVNPPTVNLAVNPASITLGSAASLTWSATTADSCTASGAWSGSRPLSGTQTVTPTSAGPMTFTLACTGPGGTTTQSAVLTVSHPVPTLTLNIAPTTITVGASSNLDWSSTHSDSCVASGEWSGSRPTIGNQAVTPTTHGNKLYVLACTGPGGSITRQVTLTVNQLPPSVSISATPPSISLGASSSIQWAATNSTSCTASGAWSGAKATSGAQAVTPAASGSFVYTISCDGPGGTGTQSASLTVNPPDPPPTITFSAAPPSITLGAATTLTWQATDAISCSASGAWSGPRGISGAESNTPTSTGSKTFSIACTGSGGTTTRTVSVTVNAPAPTLTLSAAPTTITLGQSSTLTWSSTTVDSCTASGAWTGSMPASGNMAVTPTTAGTKNFTLNCTGPGGSVSRSAQVVVNTPIPAPVVDLAAAPQSITIGSSTTLSWTASDSDSCVASGAWSGSRPTTGSSTITPGAVGTFSYVLTCTGQGGTGSDTVSVTVKDPPPELTLSANPTALTLGESSTLTWSATYSTSCTASGGWTGSKSVSGSQMVTPSTAGSTNFTLVCNGGGGTVTRSVTITATDPPDPTVSISVSPASISLGATSTVSWSSQNSDSCVASGAWSGTKATSDSQTVSPTSAGTYAYQIACTGAGGTDTRSATLTVTAPAPTLSFSATPTSLTLGNSSTLSWSSADATSCTASGAWSGAKATSGTQTVTPSSAGTAGYTISCSGTGGTITRTVSVTVAAAPQPTLTFDAAPTSMPLGSSTTLSWATSNVSSCAAGGAWSGAQPVNGSQTMTPTAAGALNFVMTCTGPGGSVSRNVTVTVTPAPAPTLSFTGSPMTFQVGGSSTLSWAATNATACSASEAWSGSKALSGNQTVTPATAGSPRFTLTCSGPGGNISRSVTLTVQPPPPPVIAFTAEPATLYIGTSTTLNWNVTGATSCAASGAWTGTRALTGTQSVTPPALGTHSWTLNCTGAGGSTARTVTASVIPYPLPTVTLTISPASINLLQTATVTWSTSMATSCVASGTAGAWTGARALNGSEVAYHNLLAPNRTYTLTCTGPGGTTTRSATLQSRLL